jgi:hypothetical protein
MSPTNAKTRAQANKSITGLAFLPFMPFPPSHPD